MSVSLDDLKPKVREAAKNALRILEDSGFAYAVTSTLRTTAEQNALYAQGRKSLIAVNAMRAAAGLRPLHPTENAYTVTNCDGDNVKSNHQSGLALDVVPREGNRPIWPAKYDARWLIIAEAFESCGFTWGGRWVKFPDYPHYEFKA